MANILSAELQANIGLADRMGDVMFDYFYRSTVNERKKNDLTSVTDADEDISDRVVEFFQTKGRPVVSEERGGTAQYGAVDAEYLDSLDGTFDFCEARRQLGRESIAAFSLGSVVEGRTVRGVVSLPLLTRPCLYFAEAGQPTFRVNKANGAIRKVEAADEEKGIILVSTNYHSYIDRLASMGFTTMGIDGAVFKACCVADPSLLSRLNEELQPAGQRVVGFVTTSAQPHDYKAAEAIAEGAGAIACATDGGKLKLTEGKHGCVFANSEAVRDLLLEAVNG